MTTELEKHDVLRLSNDESNRLTRECLRIAMIKLMDRKSFEKISVTEIAGLAGVSRTAFYRNYRSKEELIDDICRNVFDRLRESVNGELYRTDRRAWYAAFFMTAADNSEYFRIYRSARLDITAPFMTEALFPAEDPAEKYANSARIGAFFRILSDWFDGGMKETPEEMGGICAELVYNAFETLERRTESTR